MNAAATAFAHPPERRRCGRPISTRRSARARNAFDQPPKRLRVKTNQHPPPTRIWIDLTVASSFTSRSRREPDRSPKGGIA